MWHTAEDRYLPIQGETLKQALRRCYLETWCECRKGGISITSQANAAVSTLLRLAGHPADGDMLCSDVGKDLLRAAKAEWAAQGYAPATTNHRLGCLSSMGIDVRGCRARKVRVQQWWLTSEAEATLREKLAGPFAPLLLDYVTWATRSGFRVEETLRLTKSHFVGFPNIATLSVTVPGTKTAMAGNITLPLHPEAAEVALRRLEHAESWERLFDCDYDSLLGYWQGAKMVLGLERNKNATLKALRRTAARYLHVYKGMPLDVLRQYMRHENVQTTMGYLRLVGGIREEEMRRWL